MAGEQAKEIENGKLDLGNSVRSHTETYAVYERQLHIRIEALYTTVSVRFAKQRIEQGQCARAPRRQIEDMLHLLDLRRLPFRAPFRAHVRPDARVC